MLLYIQKELPRRENNCQRFEGSGVLVILVKVNLNAWFSWSANQNQNTTLQS